MLDLSRKYLTHLLTYIDQTGDQLAVQVGVQATVSVESFPGLIAVIWYLLFILGKGRVKDWIRTSVNEFCRLIPIRSVTLT